MKQNMTRNKLYNAFLGGLFASTLCFAAPVHASDAVGFMHPLGVTKAEIVKPVGQIMDKKYGVIEFQTGYMLKADTHDTTVPVYAVNSGKIVSLNDDRTSIEIIHKNGEKSRYDHVDLQDHLNIGHSLNKADIIGYLPASEQLFYELRDNEGFVINHNLQTGNLNNQNYIISSRDIGLLSAFMNECAFGVCADDGGNGNGSGNGNNRGPVIDDPYLGGGGSLGGSNSGGNNNAGGGNPYVGGSTGGSSGGSSGGNGTGGGTGGGYSTGGYTTSSSSSSSGPSYTPYSGVTGGEAAAYISANSSETCLEPVLTGLIAKKEETLAEQDAVLNTVISEPASVNDLSCFDNFATILSTTVADAGLSGSFSVFGFDVDIGQLAQQGVDALSEGACNKANSYFSDVQSAGIDVNALFMSPENQQDLLINSAPQVMDIFRPNIEKAVGIGDPYF